MPYVSLPTIIKQQLHLTKNIAVVFYQQHEPHSIQVRVSCAIAKPVNILRHCLICYVFIITICVSIMHSLQKGQYTQNRKSDITK